MQREIPEPGASFTFIHSLKYFKRSTLKIPILAYRKRAKDTRGTFKFINRKLTDNTMAKKEKDKQTNNSTQDTYIYLTLKACLSSSSSSSSDCSLIPPMLAITCTNSSKLNVPSPIMKQKSS